MLLTNTPYSIAVGQILMTRMEVVAAQTPGLVSRSMSPSELLPHLLGESSDVWIISARDILTRAQIRSKSMAGKTNGASGSNGHAQEAILGPDVVRNALEVWGQPRPITEKQVHIAGVQVFLEASLAAALAPTQEEVRRPATIFPPRAPLTASMSVGPLPFVAEGGLPILRRLLSGRPARKEGFDAYVRDFIGQQPYPIAMARMLGGDRLGQFVMVNDALLDRYKWRGREREQHLLRMALLDWYHPQDRGVLAKVAFCLARAFLGKQPEFEPQLVRGLSGDFVDYEKRHPGAKPKEEHYISYQGAGNFTLSNGVTAFGIFTEQPK